MAIPTLHSATQWPAQPPRLTSTLAPAVSGCTPPRAEPLPPPGTRSFVRSRDQRERLSRKHTDLDLQNNKHTGWLSCTFCPVGLSMPVLGFRENTTTVSEFWFAGSTHFSLGSSVKYRGSFPPVAP